MLKGESRFGAELDSLSDVIAFGVSPAVVMYLWSLQYMPQFGWTIALSHAVCCALRLARFNAQIDATRAAAQGGGLFTGIPAPAGAGLVMVPLYLWLAFGEQVEMFRSAYIVAPMDGDGRDPDGVERRHLRLGIAPPAPGYPLRGDRCDRSAWAAR